ncbi:hypothetical protein ACLF3G_29030 [Falsiroseomonas sp. HC035]|uniref:hypothetical protein n=1 Tax=Falsiroseomonas sp. HC035 TaxID=3390999 RepID=UPI003D31D8F8
MVAKRMALAVPRLHPNLADVYREEMACLRQGLAITDSGPEIKKAVSALIERVEVHPPAAT